MPESPEEIHARVVAAVGEGGRLPVSPSTAWDIFPWEVVDGALQPKVLGPPAEREEPRSGIDGEDCAVCLGQDGVRIWESWNFHVVRPERPSGLPLVLRLCSNEHLDLTDLGDDQAAELGKVSVWLTRIMSNLPHVGRVHVARWGDGSEHLHVWFFARPERLLGIRGSLAAEWNEMLPPVAEDVWLADCASVARKLATHDGRVLD